MGIEHSIWRRQSSGIGAALMHWYFIIEGTILAAFLTVTAALVWKNLRRH
ncbi:hypothetical protein FHW72_001508 [Ochrobactrum sp. RC6B]|nr:hypothetical protein [Ochrobactrum sp. RC6B]